MTARHAGVTPQQENRWSWGALAVFLVMWVAVAAVLMAARTQHPGLEAGKTWSDGNILNAGRWFDAHGLWLTKGFPRLETSMHGDGQAPVFKPYPPGAREHADAEGVLHAYMSHPPGPFWVHELVKRCGLTRLSEMRVVSQSVGLLAGLLAFMVFSRIAQNAWLGLIAAGLYMLNTPYFAFSGSLHHYPFSMLTMMAVLLGWLMFEDAQGRRARWLWLAFACAAFFLNGWFSYGDVLVVGVLVAARTLAPTGSFRLWKLGGAVLLGAMPFLALAVRVVHNGLLLGSARGGLHSLLGSASYRADASGYENLLGQTVSVWLTRLGWRWPLPGHSLTHNRQFVLALLEPGVIVLGVLLAGVLIAVWRSGWSRPARRAVLNGLALLLGGLLWFVVMTQHAVVHRHVVLLLLPGLSLTLGGLVWCGFRASAGSGARTCALVSVGFLGLFVAGLRHSETLNQLLPLDEEIRGRIMDLRKGNERLERAGASLAGVRLLHVTPWAPREAYALGLPFRYNEFDIPESMSADEALFLIAWRADHVRSVLDAVRRFGLPEGMSRPPHRSFVFRGGGGRDSAASIPIHPRASITAARWSLTLDGEHAALTLRISGDLDLRLAQRFNLRLAAEDASGAAIASETVRIAWQHIFDERDACVVLMLPAEAAAGAERITLRLWDTEASRGVEFPSDSGLPGWMSRSPDGTELRWRPQTPRPRRADGR